MSVRSERIKSLIEQSEKSYQELEKFTGIKKSSLQRYASGATSKIPLDVIEKLSKAFNVSQEYLMGWSDSEKKDFQIKNDQLVAVISRLRADSELADAVMDLISLPKEQFETIKRLLATLRQD